MSVEPNKIIYSMMRVSKFYEKKPILKDISLSYFYGAKIGVLGLNGSGKSSLLRLLRERDPAYHPPPLLDPFAGGGSIPLEALRLGCETYANDYNPVAVFIEKATLEWPQK